MSDHALVVLETFGTYIIIAIEVVGLIATRVHNVSAARSINATAPRPYWPWVLLGLTVWIPFYLTYAARNPSSASRALVQWGTGADNSICSGLVDGTALAEQADKYRVILVCGIVDPMTDQLEDTRITVSPMFTIVERLQTISVPFSAAMNDGVKKVLADATRNMAPPPQPKAGSVVVLNVTWHPWYQLALLPIDSDVSDIHRLSDVTKHGGLIIATAAGSSSVNVMEALTPTPAPTSTPTPL